MSYNASIDDNINRVYDMFGYLMSPEAKAYNNAMNRALSSAYERDQYNQLVDDVANKVKPYIDQMVAKSIDIQVQNNATPKLKELDMTLKNLGQL